MKLLRTLFLVMTSLATTVQAGTDDDLQKLLQQIKQDRVTESKANKQREAEFLSERNRQQQLLSEAQSSLKQQQTRADSLNGEYDTNEKQLVELKEVLEQRKGTLGEMFGLVRQTANDTRGLFEASLVSGQYPERTDLLQKLSSSTELPSIADLEQMWIGLYEAMVAAGQTDAFEATVVYGEGNEARKEIVRVGPFNAVSEGRYLNYVPQTGKFEDLARQPADRVLETAENIATASDYTPFYLDPSRGVILSLLVQTPSVRERIDQGGPVGYVIIAIGIIGLLLAAFAYIRLSRIGSKVRQQMKSDEIIEGNPMGEVLRIYKENQHADVETLELKLDEVIVKNAPQLERGVGFIKLFASVAPLLGLLGTVVGMIATFQAITLFGTGDPKLMAGGISEALVTTMLGLIVAVPLIFAHSIVHGKSRRLIQILEEQGAGFIAMHKEKHLTATTSA